jgi:hypothetical protein
VFRRARHSLSIPFHVSQTGIWRCPNPSERHPTGGRGGFFGELLCISNKNPVVRNVWTLCRPIVPKNPMNQTILEFCFGILQSCFGNASLDIGRGAPDTYVARLSDIRTGREWPTDLQSGWQHTAPKLRLVCRNSAPFVWRGAGDRSRGENGFSVRANSTPCVQMPISHSVGIPIASREKFSRFAGKYQLTSGSITIGHMPFKKSESSNSKSETGLNADDQCP